MFREINQERTDSIVSFIRTLPASEQKLITRRLNSKKKLSLREKRKVQELKGIADGLREIKEAKSGGKQLMDLEDALNEL